MLNYRQNCGYAYHDIVSLEIIDNGKDTHAKDGTKAPYFLYKAKAIA